MCAFWDKKYRAQFIVVRYPVKLIEVLPIVVSGTSVKTDLGSVKVSEEHIIMLLRYTYNLGSQDYLIVSYEFLTLLLYKSRR